MHHRFLALSLGCLFLAFTGVRAENVPPSENLFPNTTAGFVSVTNVDTLSEHWGKTQLGELMADPVMKPFTEDIRRQFNDRWSGFHERLGLTLDDLRNVPGGEAALAIIRPKPGESATALMIDVTGHQDAAKEMLERVAKNLQQQQAKKSERNICEVPVTVFDLPKPKRETTAAAAKEENNQPQFGGRTALYCLKGDLLLVADRADIMEAMLKRLTTKCDDTLAAWKPFVSVMERCAKDGAKDKPQIRWYLNPLAYADAARAATPEENRRKGKSIVDVLDRQGIGALQGVGGHVSFAAEDFELIHRTAVYAPKPWKNAMKMLVLPPGKDFAPQSWVPRDIATYTTLYFDIQNAFDNFDSLFEELFAEGESGAWEEVKRGLEIDPDGPQINLRKELIAHLGPRVTVLSDYQLPITTQSERLFFAIESSNDKAVASSIEKLMKDDKNAKRREIDGLLIWEMVEDEMEIPDLPTVTLPGAPSVTLPGSGTPGTPEKKEPEKKDEEKKFLPHAAITVVDGHLFCASHMDFLLKILKTRKQPNPLNRDVSYKLVDETIGTFAFPQKSARAFSFTDEEYRATYELVRQNKMPEGETMLARAINALFGSGKKGQTRKSQLDGEKLPDYEMVRRYLGPAGMAVISEPEGWFLKGFTLTKPR